MLDIETFCIYLIFALDNHEPHELQLALCRSVDLSVLLVLGELAIL